MKTVIIIVIIFLNNINILNAVEGKSNSLSSTKHESFMEKLLSPGKLSKQHAFLEDKKCFSCHQEGKGVLNDGCLKCHANIQQKITLKRSFHYKNKDKKCFECHLEHKGRDFDIKNSKYKIDPTNFNHDKHLKETGVPLVGVHGEISCVRCHKEKSYLMEVSGDSCLACHKDTFHNFQRSKNFPNWEKFQDCKMCHREEKNGWKQATFEHSKYSTFNLVGIHKNLSCQKCHQQAVIESENKILNNKKNTNEKKCLDCHQEQYKHNFKMLVNNDCNQCHLQISWKNLNLNNLKKFNHQEVAPDFLLNGKHKRLACLDCHKKNKQDLSFHFRNQNKEITCVVCHQDVHANAFRFSNINNKQGSKDCQKCHPSFETFKVSLINTSNHKDFSSFALNGKHSQLKCTECHFDFLDSGKNFVKSQGRDVDGCISCHQDFHKGKYGNNCVSCHSEYSWKIDKNFHKDRELGGMHLNLDCSECHKNFKQLKGESRNCKLCHQKDDVHQRGLPNCSECHGENSWNITKFKHSLTSFPLLGAHRALNCIDCHKNGIYNGKSKECISCHRNDAVRVVRPKHNMPQFEDCKNCHNQFSFK